MTTPREVRDIDEAIATADRDNTAAKPGGISLYASVVSMGELYIVLKNMGVDKDNILDLMRIVFMFAGPSDPQMVAAAVADSGPKEQEN